MKIPSGFVDIGQAIVRAASVVAVEVLADGCAMVSLRGVDNTHGTVVICGRRPYADVLDDLAVALKPPPPNWQYTTSAKVQP